MDEEAYLSALAADTPKEARIAKEKEKAIFALRLDMGLYSFTID